MDPWANRPDKDFSSLVQKEFFQETRQPKVKIDATENSFMTNLSDRTTEGLNNKYS